MTKEKKQDLFIYFNALLIIAILLFYASRGIYYYITLGGAG